MSDLWKNCFLLLILILFLQEQRDHLIAVNMHIRPLRDYQGDHNDDYEETAAYSSARAPRNQTSWYQINQRKYLKGHQSLLANASFVNFVCVDPVQQEVFAMAQAPPCSAN